MTNESSTLAPIAAAVATARTAGDYLDEMMARVGVDGLAAAFAESALLAGVDQHAAAVREALADAERAVDAEGLAAYARSVVAGAIRIGRPIPEAGEAPRTAIEWLGAEWSLVRLVAVCLIAEDAGLL